MQASAILSEAVPINNKLLSAATGHISDHKIDFVSESYGGTMDLRTTIDSITAGNLKPGNPWEVLKQDVEKKMRGEGNNLLDAKVQG